VKILVLSPIDPGALARLQATHDIKSGIGASDEMLREMIRDREAIVFRSGVALSADLMGCAPNLRLLLRAGSGFDNVDLEHATARGIEFVRIPEPGARAVAELAFGLMLALARNIRLADQRWRRGEWVKHELPGYLLHRKVLGIVGAGSIGSTVGEMAQAWGMEVIGCVGRPTPAARSALTARNILMTDFDEVIERADFLTLHVPLRPTTRNLIDAGVLRRMKPGSYLINLARGGVVDEPALRKALLAGDTLRGAALDVHSVEGHGAISPLADLSSVLLTPHIGSTTVDTQREIGERIEEIIRLHDAPTQAGAQTPVEAA
jgi:D-3-phosphoglycerate dehydrogenase / 2-oxoglutarate reductase